MKRPYLISAIGTPLHDDESLHVEGLLAHLEQQHSAKMDGILVAGTMGLLPLLHDDTYKHLVRTASQAWNQRGELFVGIGDTSFSRTIARLEFVSNYAVDGVVVLAPYFIQYSQSELINYYKALADRSNVPLFLYDLPQRIGTSLEVETVLQLSKHPRIVGIKCSGDVSQTQRLRQEISETDFRVIIAKPMLLDVLTRSGMQQHLDGIFSIVPHWIHHIADLIFENEWDRAGVGVHRLGKLMDVFDRYGIFQSMTEILNSMGVPGSFAPRPFALLDDERRHALLNERVVRGIRDSQGDLLPENGAALSERILLG